MLSVEGLTINLRGAQLITAFSASLGPGECIGLEGVSGCGKTTLLRGIAGLVDSQSGNVTLDGMTPEQLGWPAFRRKVVYSAQDPVMYAGSVEANLCAAFRFQTAKTTYSAERALSHLKTLGLGAEVLYQRAESLSVGQRQRVALVRALLLTPRVLLMDEPTSALDRVATTGVEKLIQSFLQCGGAAFVVSHDTGLLRRTCDRTITLGGLP